jgi:threonine dehydrogenase-like Zn-dependent dehydrogenase
MKAFIITAPRTAGIEAIEPWAPAAGEILVRPKAVAVCTLERRLFSGSLPRYPAIGGHEVAGVVEWVGEHESTFRPGDRVAVDVMNRCGHCHYCRKGSDNLCANVGKPRRSSNFFVPGGGFAESLPIPSGQAVKLPGHVGLEEASLIEPLACCLHSVKRAHLSPGETAAILGAGTMGTLHTLLAKLREARTIISDPDEGRLGFVQGQGADVTVNPRLNDPVQLVRDCTQGRGADVVFVPASSFEAGNQALAMVAPTGRVILYGSLHPTALLQLDWNYVHHQEITVTGSANNTHRDFQEAASLLVSGAITLQPLISRVIGLDELCGELMSYPAGSTQRVVVRM